MKEEENNNKRKRPEEENNFFQPNKRNKISDPLIDQITKHFPYFLNSSSDMEILKNELKNGHQSFKDFFLKLLQDLEHLNQKNVVMEFVFPLFLMSLSEKEHHPFLTKLVRETLKKIGTSCENLTLILLLFQKNGLDGKSQVCVVNFIRLFNETIPFTRINEKGGPKLTFLGYIGADLLFFNREVLLPKVVKNLEKIQGISLFFGLRHIKRPFTLIVLDHEVNFRGSAFVDELKKNLLITSFSTIRTNYQVVINAEKDITTCINRNKKIFMIYEEYRLLANDFSNPQDQSLFSIDALNSLFKKIKNLLEELYDLDFSQYRQPFLLELSCFIKLFEFKEILNNQIDFFNEFKDCWDQIKQHTSTHSLDSLAQYFLLLSQIKYQDFYQPNCSVVNLNSWAPTDFTLRIEIQRLISNPKDGSYKKNLYKRILYLLSRMSELTPEMEGHRNMVMNALFNDTENNIYLKKYPTLITDNLHFLFYSSHFLETIQTFLKRFPLDFETDKSLLDPPNCFKVMYHMLSYLKGKDEIQLREALCKILTAPSVFPLNTDFLNIQNDDDLSLNLIPKTPDLIKHYVLHVIQLSEVFKLFNLISLVKLGHLYPILLNGLPPIAYLEINNKELLSFIAYQININNNDEETKSVFRLQ